MSEEVGNLRVRLSLDNAQFERSAASMNRTLQAMGQEIRGLQNRGREWGSSIEGLRTKQEALNRMLEAQQTRVRRLAEDHAKAVEQHGEHSRQAEQLAVQLNRASAEMDRTQRELNETTADLDRQERELAQSQTMWARFGEAATAAGNKLKAVGDKMTSIGKDLSMKLTAPIVAMGVGVVKTAADFEAQMDRVGAIAGATGNEIDKLSETAMHLGASTSKSAKEVAIGMEEMAAMGFAVNDIIGAMPGVISAAEASGSDMAQTAEVMASTLNIFGKEASEASKVADILAMTANISAANLTDMQYALKYAGPPAAALGISLEETAAAIGLMTNAGMKGEQAGTTLRGALLGLLDPSEENSKRMDKMGIAITDASGNFVGLSQLIKNLQESMEGQTDTQKAATLAALVGKEAVSGMLTLMKAGPETIDSMTKSLENSGGASAEAAAKMKDNLKGALEELGGALETASIQLGNVLIPIIRDIAEKMQGLVEKFSELSPATQNTILALAGVAAAIGPLLVVGGLMTSSLGAIFTAFGTVSGAIAVMTTGAVAATPAIGGLATAFTVLTGLIGLAIAAMAAIGIGAVVVGKELSESSIQTENWSNKVSESTAKAVGSFMDLSDQASGHLTNLSITGQVVTQEMASNITSVFSQMGQQVLAEMQVDHTEQLNAISSFYANSNVLIEGEEAEILAKTAEYQANKEKQISDGNARIAEIMNTASNEKRALTLAEEFEISSIHAKMKDNAVKYMTESEREQKVIYEAMKNNASEMSALQAAEVVKNSVKQKDEVVKEAEEQYKKAVAEIIKQRDEMGVISGQQAKQLIEDAGKQRDETIKAAEEMHVEIVGEAKVQAGEHVDQVDWETGEIKSKWQVMKQDVTARMKEIGANIKRDWNQSYADAKKSVTDMATSVSNKFSEIGESVGIKMNEAKEFVVTKWNEAQTFLRGINLLQIGKDIVNGLIKGIGEKFGGVQTKIEELAGMIPQWAKDILGIKSPSRVMMAIGRDVGAGLVIGIENSKNDVANAAKDIAKQTYKTFEEIPANLNGFMKIYFRDLMGIDIKVNDLNRNGDAYGADLLKFYKTALELEHWDRYQREAIMERFEKEKELSVHRLTAMSKDYNNKVMQFEQERAAKQSELLIAYENEVTKRTDEINKRFGLLDSVEMKSIDGDDLIGSLDSQINAMETYTESVEKLASRGISGKLLEEISALGPSMAGQVASFANLTEEELNRYVELWNKKNEIARKTAEFELTAMREDMEKQLKAIDEESERELNKFKENYEFLYNEVHGITEREMNELKRDMVQDGKDAMQGLINGMESQRSNLMATAQSIADAVSSTIQSALQIQSPSKIMRGFGVNIGEGLVIGMDDMLAKVAQSSARLSDAVVSAQSFNPSRGNTTTSTVDNRKSFAQTVNVYTTESPEKVMQRELRRMAFQF